MSYTYVAQSTHIDPALIPYHSYKSLVLTGARYHNFPVEYVATIEATPSMPDPDVKRTQEGEKLLRQMGRVNPHSSWAGAITPLDPQTGRR